MRAWSVRHARGLHWCYERVEQLLVVLDPLLRRIGYRHVERPLMVVERAVKGALFDSQSCGQCLLSATGMSCPMNCPKSLRNGPCGGVRANGHCEILPEMPCVWVKAWEGSQKLNLGISELQVVQPALDRRLQNSSAWLRAARGRVLARSQSQSLGSAGAANRETSQ